MKKQLIAAAVAATMSSVAMADISLTGDVTAAVKQTTGGATVNWNELNLAITGTDGASKAVVTMTSTAAGTFAVDESYVTTDMEGLSLAIGTKDGRTGTAMTHSASASSKVVVGTKLAGVKASVTYKTGSADGSVTLATNVAGFGVKMQNALNTARYTTITGDVAGVAVVAELSKAADAFSVSKEISGINFTYADIDAGSNDNADQDSMFGNIDGHTNISGVVASTSTALGKVTIKDYSSTKSTGVATDTTKITVKRGNVAYTFQDTDGTNSVEAKVRFKF